MEKDYKEAFDKFPPEIQDAITTQADRRTPIQWQMYYKAKPQLDASEEEVGTHLKAQAKERWGELKSELAKFDAIKPAPEPLAQAMIDRNRDQPRAIREALAPARGEPHQRDRVRPAGHREHERRQIPPGREQRLRLAGRDR